MHKKIITAALICLLLVGISGFSQAQSNPISNTAQVVLLPVEQSQVREDFQIPCHMLMSSLQQEFMRLNSLEFMGYDCFVKEFEETLIDEAVFELLVTDQLYNTLAMMEAVTNPAEHPRQLNKIAAGMNVSYFIRLTIHPQRRQLRLTYQIKDTASGRVMDTQTTFDVKNDPTGLSSDLAKNITRSLWQLERRIRFFLQYRKLSRLKNSSICQRSL